MSGGWDDRALTYRYGGDRSAIISPVPRYIVQAGEVEYRLTGGRTTEPLWIGIETLEPINLEFLSLHGYDAIPCSGMTEDEIRSVGVDHFELLGV